MSQYPNYYIRPVFKKEKQQELEKEGEITKIAHVPIRAALNDQTCSIMHDDAIRLFTNYVMKGGQKTLAREIVEKAFEKVKRIQIEKYHTSPPEKKEQIELNPRKIFYDAVENCKPLLQLTPIKRGGVRYQVRMQPNIMPFFIIILLYLFSKVPIPVTEKRSQFLSMKWLIEAAREKERTIHFPEKLAWELIDAAQNQGRVVKRKQDLHRQCETNRAYAHYRWS